MKFVVAASKILSRQKKLWLATCLAQNEECQTDIAHLPVH